MRERKARADKLNSVMQSEIYKMLQENNVVFSQFDGKTVLITGATGLNGYNLIASLMLYGTDRTNPPRVIALVRNMEKAKKAPFRYLHPHCPYPRLSLSHNHSFCMPC